MVLDQGPCGTPSPSPIPGTNQTTVQDRQFTVSDLAEVLKTDFTAGNRILTKVSDFYTSCIAAQLMNQTEFVDNFIPVNKLI